MKKSILVVFISLLLLNSILSDDPGLNVKHAGIIAIDNVPFSTSYFGGNLGNVNKKELILLGENGERLIFQTADIVSMEEWDESFEGIPGTPVVIEIQGDAQFEFEGEMYDVILPEEKQDNCKCKRICSGGGFCCAEIINKNLRFLKKCWRSSCVKTQTKC